MALTGAVTRVLLWPSLLKTLGIMALIEAVFLAEVFEGLMNEVLSHGGRIRNLAWLLLLNAPDIAALALALGLMVALFFAISDARSRGELLILASSGIAWRRVVGFALVLGCAGGALAWGVAGQVVPRAQLAQQVAVATLQADHLRDRIIGRAPHRRVQSIDRMTVITPENQGHEPPPIFIFEDAQNRQWRAGLSPDWAITAPEADEQHRLVMRALVGYSGRLTTGPTDNMTIDSFRTDSATFAFAMDTIVPVPVPQRPVDLVSKQKTPTDLLARILLVPMAALAGLVALLYSGGLARFVALPLALLWVMVMDVAGRGILSAAQLPFGPLVVLAVIAYLAPPLALIAAKGEGLMTPQRAAP